MTKEELEREMHEAAEWTVLACKEGNRDKHVAIVQFALAGQYARGRRDGTEAAANRAEASNESCRCGEYLASEIRALLPSPEEKPTQEEKMEQKETMLQFFEYAHLPAHLQVVSKPFGDLAAALVKDLPRNPERTVALRKLLEAKDCAVRAILFKQ